MPTKLIIVGGVAGGATAAARARRLDENADIVLFERGEYISFANCGLPYYIGGTIKKRDNLLVATAEFFSERYAVDVRVFCEVTAIDPVSKQVTVTDLRTGRSYTENYDKLILSPGARPLRPPLEGIDSPLIFNLRNIPDTDRIKEFVDSQRPKAAVIVGGGYIGLEMAENLAERGIAVTIVEMLGQVMAPLDPEMAGLVQAHLEEKGVRLVLGEGVKAFKPGSNGSLVVNTSQGREIPADFVMLSAGIRPENELAKRAGLAIGDRGGIQVNSRMQTSDPNIFAVGDAVEVRDVVTGEAVITALAGPANKQGRIAADNALGRSSTFRGTLGTAVVKVFDRTAAATGASEKTLVQHKIPHLISYTHSNSHAEYYPDATVMAVKLIFTPGAGRLMGAQIVGQEGVDKRIDVLATAIHGNMTVFDLEELELAYAPPYSSAKDPVNIAGYVAANLLKGDLKERTVHDLRAGALNSTAIIDLRTKPEIRLHGRIEPSVHIPIDELRSRLPELDQNNRYLLYCAAGYRGYIGYRIMVQNGFNVTNLAGGYLTYAGAQKTAT
jgi:NADPH-dependent 2,4-dienoyl-CoA reductase/sulfur reductase-like enzyme/rhodanese-related sulfurtransferase